MVKTQFLYFPEVAEIFSFKLTKTALNIKYLGFSRNKSEVSCVDFTLVYTQIFWQFKNSFRDKNTEFFVLDNSLRLKVYRLSMIIGCNIWAICLKLNWLFYDPSWMLQLSEFVWTLRSSVWVVFNNFLLIDATDKTKISSNHHRIFFDVSMNDVYLVRIVRSSLTILTARWNASSWDLPWVSSNSAAKCRKMIRLRVTRVKLE